MKAYISVLASELVARIIGSIALLGIWYELRRVVQLIDHPWLKRILTKVSLLFLIYSVAKIITSGFDWWVGAAIIGIMINNLAPFWLWYFVRVRRKRLEVVAEDSSARDRLRTHINGILAEMRITKQELDTKIGNALA